MNLCDSKKINILLIGCGGVGAEIARKLVDKQYINKLFLYDKKGVVCEKLKRKLKSSNINIINDLNNDYTIDYTILAISAISPKKRQNDILICKSNYCVRHKELDANIKSIRPILPFLAGLKSKIIVITNPVDEITNFLIKRLDSKRVIGFGLELDALRYKKILKRKVLCIGIHGKSIPIVNFKTAKEYNHLYKTVDQNLLEYVKKFGIPYKLAAGEFERFFDNLLKDKETILMFSSFLTKSFCGVKNIAVSIPFKVKNGKIIAQAKFKINNIEKEKFARIVNQLKENIKYL